jgi:hypothetical protein
VVDEPRGGRRGSLAHQGERQDPVPERLCVVWIELMAGV